MTFRQKFLRIVYPAWMWFSRLAGRNDRKSSGYSNPLVPFYSLRAKLNNGTELDFSTLKGKKVLIVNTASNCGYTAQYKELQALSIEFDGKLVVIGFPSNDFKEQEKGSDEEIANFCQVNFGVSFPLMKKSVVTRSAGQNPVFQWLTEAKMNGWNNKPPSWNFTKYLVNEEGSLVSFFGPSIPPLGRRVKDAIRR